MKRHLIYLFIFSLVIFSSGCKKQDETSDVLDKVLSRDKLIVGVKFDTKPFGYIDENHNLTGFDIELAKYIAKNLLGSEKKVEFKQVTPSNRILSLNSGQIDMIIATMTMTPERKEVIDFSKPYYMAGQAILVPSDSSITSMSDLNGKRVIIIFGSTAEKNTRLMAPEAKISGYKTYTNGYSALKQGRADAITSDDTILMGFVMQDDSVKLLPKRYSKEPYAIGFRKGESSKRLRQRVDLILDEMIKSAQMTQLKAKWVKY